MNNSNRWQVGDHGRPYFDGDLHQATAKDTMLVVTAHELRPLAKEIETQLEAFLENEVHFRGAVGQIAAKIARGRLGQDRPLNDDDREYYALCDLLVTRITNTVLRGASTELDRSLLRR